MEFIGLYRLLFDGYLSVLRGAYIQKPLKPRCCMWLYVNESAVDQPGGWAEYRQHLSRDLWYHRCGCLCRAGRGSPEKTMEICVFLVRLK